MCIRDSLYSLVTMPRREDPKITIHVGIVAAVYPGATAREVEDQVTSKIEERLFRVAEVRRDKTYSTTRNGMVVVNVELDKSIKDTDAFWSKLRLDMAQLKATELPAGVLGPVVDSDFGDTVAVLIAVHGGNYEMCIRDRRVPSGGCAQRPWISIVRRWRACLLYTSANRWN